MCTYYLIISQGKQAVQGTIVVKRRADWIPYNPEAQLGGGGGRARAPPPAEWKERKNGENQYHRNKKTNRVIEEIIL